jgi:hypothetical protein
MCLIKRTAYQSALTAGGGIGVDKISIPVLEGTIEFRKKRHQQRKAVLALDQEALSQ